MGISELITKAVMASYNFKPIDKLVRFDGNPVLSAKDVPYEATLIFNAGVIKRNGKYYMLFRDDYSISKINRCKFKTHIGFATSDDGIHWNVSPKPFIHSDDVANDEIRRMYDPRLMEVEGKLYMCFAMDTNHGLRGGVAEVNDDFSGYKILSLSIPDDRNMVLFPEKINGKFVRLERPMPVYSRGRRELFDMWISASPDMRYWGDSELLLGQEQVKFSNCKIGPAAPPIKTDRGWLATFHAVIKNPFLMKNGWERKWKKIYSAGIMLLDLENPYKVLGVCQEPLILPTVGHEAHNGFRNNAVFPCGMVKEDDGTVKIYYGAGDIVVYLATAKVDDLIELCLKEKN